MEDPEKLDNDTLEGLGGVVAEYPYFHTARLLYTKNLHLANVEGYREELGRSALFCNDRKRLFYLIYREEYGKLLDREDRDIHSNRADRTEQLLESFLSSLGERATDEREIIEPSIENVAFNLATTDYFSYLQSLDGKTTHLDQAEGAQRLEHQDIIDAFIEKAASDTLFVPKESKPAETVQEREEKEEGGEFLTETLARIYIKQKKYEQALTIIKRLSLNFPKKSVYFAHQIRFLELLIINAEKNKEK